MESAVSLLLQQELLEAMNKERPEERLVVCPLLENKQVGVGTIDLRLGTQFIEARRWTEAGIDPLMLAPDCARSKRKSWS